MRILSGLQPSGQLHLGNFDYFGMMQPTRIDKTVADPEAVAKMEHEVRAGGIGYRVFKNPLFEANWLKCVGPVRSRSVAHMTLERVRKGLGLGSKRKPDQPV